jgi:HAE1 family hydrophobic/amphiphilic exporter-1
MGLVVKNAILIVDFTNQLKAEGKHFKEALIIAGKGRMRPILMTTLQWLLVCFQLQWQQEQQQNGKTDLLG